MSNRMFLQKTEELRREYDGFLSRLEILEDGDPEQIRLEKERIVAESNEGIRTLKRTSETARSSAVQKLAKKQTEYYGEMRKIAEKELPSMVNANEDMSERQVEAASLYAEYMLDFAKEACMQALRAAYTAADMEFSFNEIQE